MRQAFRSPVLIYNPVAGKLKRNNQRLLNEVVEALRSSGLEPLLCPTHGPNSGGALAAQHIQQGADLIIAFGGDGTVNEVASGMIGTAVPLAILPGGTANVFSIETGGGTNPVKAARRFAERVPHRIAVGKLRGDGVGPQPRHFIAMTGTGLDARIVRDVRPGLKKVAGKLAYWVAGITQFLRPLHRVVTNEGESFGFVLASRVRNYGGDFEIANQASLLRDEFEVVSFQGTNPLIYAFYMAGVLIRMHPKLPGVRVTKATRLDFPEPGAFVQVDGELAGMTPASIEIVPDALTVLLPREFKG